MGKTLLTDEERTWLAPNDNDGGRNIVDLHVNNTVFVYDQTQMKEVDYFWNDLASYLKVSHIPDIKQEYSKGKNLQHLNICDPKYDTFRSWIMPYSYELAVWLQQYFLPLANDSSTTGVYVPNLERLLEIVETYKQDPCGRLISQIDDDDEVHKDARPKSIKYVLDPSFNTVMIPPPNITKDGKVVWR
jgi:hypothetical protein